MISERTKNFLFIIADFFAVLTLFFMAGAIIYATFFKDPNMGCVFSSYLRDHACPVGSLPETDGCKLYESVSNAICPVMYRMSWDL
jgi:hypothetical protein